ncbi:7,8-dihydro-6-hydroxymethylpterin-pyrophosphokinase [gamma proteobacterium HdN1]|nr:7,8-dihydro-6-hydroxymethylpterin-pyrophosphokinase [gamma proteobacterium HdN1]
MGAFMFYFCSLGSNIDPPHNVALALQALASSLAEFTLSPLIQTKPHGMESQQPFYNALFWFESTQSPESIKAWFNETEIKLGRDRNHPEKKLRDRPIDLDILYAGERKPLAELAVKDPYLAPLTPVLQGKAPAVSAITLPFGGRRLGLGIFRIRSVAGQIQIERATAEN